MCKFDCNCNWNHNRKNDEQMLLLILNHPTWSVSPPAPLHRPDLSNYLCAMMFMCMRRVSLEHMQRNNWIAIYWYWCTAFYADSVMVCQHIPLNKFCNIFHILCSKCEKCFNLLMCFHRLCLHRSASLSRMKLQFFSSLLNGFDCSISIPFWFICDFIVNEFISFLCNNSWL